MAEGVLVAVEGIDRSGKTTLVAALHTALTARGIPTVTRTEPSRGPIGTFFRQVTDHTTTALPAIAAALLSAADRHQQQPALREQLAGHRVVVADRYYLSGLAYHLAEGIDPGFYGSLNHGIRRPDLYLYLVVDPAVAARRGQPPQGRWEQPTLTAALPDAYCRCAGLLTRTEAAHVVQVDATQPPDRVLAQALAVVQALTLERRSAA